MVPLTLGCRLYFRFVLVPAAPGTGCSVALGLTSCPESSLLYCPSPLVFFMSSGRSPDCPLDSAIARCSFYQMHAISGHGSKSLGCAALLTLRCPSLTLRELLSDINWNVWSKRIERVLQI